MTPLGTLILQARTDASLSRERLARELDVSHSTIVRMEAGTVDIRLSTLHALAEATGKPLSYFLDGVTA